MKPLSTSDLQKMLDDFEAQGFGAGGAAIVPPKPSPSVKPLSKLALAISTPSEHDIAVMEDALSYVSPDVPRGMGTIIGSDGLPTSDYWLGSIWAIRRYAGEAGKEPARKWSQQSSRYTDAGFDQAWKQYKPGHANPVTIGSVFMLAKACGWQAAPLATASPPTPSTNRFHLLDRSAIMAIKPIQWRVKRLLPTTGIAAIFGPSGSGKSFLAKDMGICIASGREWFGHRTAQCSVTYVMLEGEAGLRNRVAAWEAHNGFQLPGGFYGLVQPVRLADEQDVEDLGTILPKGGVVIIDTLNRAAPGMDENSSQDMGKILAGMKRLQEVTEGLVVIVHHTGKDASKGLRGHSSLIAALDGAIEVERTATSRSWSAAKVKDGEDGQAVAFKLHSVELGKDADGDPITSCAAGPDTGAIFRKPEPTGKSQKSALSTIRRLLSTSSDTGQAGCDPQTQCMKVEAAIAGVAAALTTVETNKRRNRARSLVQGLLSDCHLHSATDGGGEAWLWQ